MPGFGNYNSWIGFICALYLSISTGTARANWTTNQDGPDVFGTTTVVSIAIGGSKSFVVQCDDKDQLFLALIFPKKKFDQVTIAPAELLLQSDRGTPIHLVAELRTWNDDYAGVVAEGRSPEILKVLRDIRSENEKLNAGVVVGGFKDSASFEADGSTSAMDSVFKGCKLGDSVSSR